MSDLISRQGAIDDIWTVSPLARLDHKWIDRWLRQLPPIQPKRGKWIIKDDTERFIAQCNCCRYIEDSRRIKNFCPNCGAKMGVTE